MAIRHSKVSGKPAGNDSTKVYGSDWDADHVLTGTANKVLCFDSDGDALEANRTGDVDSDIVTGTKGVSGNLAVWDAHGNLVDSGLSLSAEPLSLSAATNTVPDTTPSVAIQRAAPTATTINLPPVANRSGIPLRIFDWSTSVTGHTITLVPDGTETIMQLSSFPMFSNSSQLSSVTLYPSTILGGWYTAP